MHQYQIIIKYLMAFEFSLVKLLHTPKKMANKMLVTKSFNACSISATERKTHIPNSIHTEIMFLKKKKKNAHSNDKIGF